MRNVLNEEDVKVPAYLKVVDSTQRLQTTAMWMMAIKGPQPYLTWLQRSAKVKNASRSRVLGMCSFRPKNSSVLELKIPAPPDGIALNVVLNFLLASGELGLQEGLHHNMQRGLHHNMQGGLHHNMQGGLHHNMQGGLHHNMQGGLHHNMAVSHSKKEKESYS